MKYKLICSDLDDTILDSSGNEGATLKGEIKRYTDAGGKFCIVTGRMPEGALPVARRLGLLGELIGYQGAVVVDIATGAILSREGIPTADAVEVIQHIEHLGEFVQTYEADYVLTRKCNQYSDRYCAAANADYQETEIPLSQYVQEHQLTPPKVILIAEEERIPVLLSALQTEFSHRFLINTSKPWLIEIVPNWVSKGLAVEKLAKKYQVQREEIICIGDSTNDLTMIEYAGLGVVVGNATGQVRELASVIAPSCDEDGVAFVIREYGFLS